LDLSKTAAHPTNERETSFALVSGGWGIITSAQYGTITHQGENSGDMGRYKTGLARETNPASPGITRFVKVGNGAKVGIVFSTIYPQAEMTWGAATAELAVGESAASLWW